jgi:hypothetical protein
MYANEENEYSLHNEQKQEEISVSRIRGKGKAIPVTGRGGLQGCETSRLPHFLDNQLTNGGEVFSLTLRPSFILRKIPGIHFC